MRAGPSPPGDGSANSQPMALASHCFWPLLELPRKSGFRVWQRREFGEIYLKHR